MTTAVDVNMEESTENEKEKTKELDEAHKIFKKIYSKAPVILKNLKDESIDIDFKESIGNDIDLLQIEIKLKEEKYESLADVVMDIRHVFLNCYKYFGCKNENTSKTLELEEILDKSISCLDERLRLLADVQHAIDAFELDNKSNYKYRYPKDCYDSVLLRSVAHCRPERLKEYHKVLSNTLTTDEDSATLLGELLKWENEVSFNEHYSYISSMWELPEIGDFLSILFREYDFEIINQGEIERMFLMPKESTAMGKIMTTLLMPIRKSKYINKIMPYKVWSEKLSKKVSEWFKVYHSKKRNKVFKSLGIHADFWAVIGDKNPLVDYDYCELSYLMKVWLVKGLCDYSTNKHKRVSDIILNCNERQCTIWKNEMETEEYFYLNNMPDLRLYYSHISYDEPDFEFLKVEEVDEEDKEGATSIISGVRSIYRPRSRVKPNGNNFKLLADSVQGIRTFVEDLIKEDKPETESLINSLEDFIDKVEPEECNFIVLNNNSKIKLFKDWKSYTERSQNVVDEVLFWEEKENKHSKLDLVTSEEIILEKRKRRAVVHQGFDFNAGDSDEYHSDKWEDSTFCDFSDSEDEWGALHQSKNSRSKQTNHAPSKLSELEKQSKEKNKTPKRRLQKNNSVDDVADNPDAPFEEPTNKKCRNGMVKNSRQNVIGPSESNDNEAESPIEDRRHASLKADGAGAMTVQVKTEYSATKNILKGVKTEPSTDDGQRAVTIGADALPTKHLPMLITNGVDGVDSSRQASDGPVTKKYKNDIISDDNQNELSVFDDKEDIVVLCKEPTKDQDPLPKSDGKTLGVGDDGKESIGKKSGQEMLNLKDNEVIALDDENSNDSITVKPANETNNVIVIEDEDDKIVISDDEEEDDVQFVSVTTNTIATLPKISSVMSNRNISQTPPRRSPVVINRNRRQVQQASNGVSVPRLSPNVTVMPANVSLPKGIQVSVVRKPQSTIPSHFNMTKRHSTTNRGVNGHTTTNNNSSHVNVKCKVISKPNYNGEVKFYVSLPNGNHHPVSDELINQYLREHNNRLPDYWLVPLSRDVAKQYGY
ncbi:uncharacterized protein LOC126845937 isoform X2 [Adelges cooleyi]|uniref:uncharacterized protein LOC126845937 isoform X2 n=1 Tax=Adelges cooleyi TaxID=133065 RepID=UPI0021804EC1|nr:uncharacterized protein LOC126845937 isoform X2 [Adelges cooleyi]